MRLLLSFIILLILSGGNVQAADSVQISADEWATPRSGERIVSMPGLAPLIHDYLQQTDARLVMSHPGGEQGSLWAEELRAWLVALGIDSEHVVLEPGSARADVITLMLDIRK